MAEETLGSLVVRVGLDGADFNKGLKNINARMQLARSELKAIASQFDDFGKTVDSLRAKQDNLAKIYQLQGQRVQQLKKQYDELVKAHGAESEAALNAGKRLNNAIAYYNKLGKELESVREELQELEKQAAYQSSVWGKAEKALSSFQQKANSTSETLKTIGENLTAKVSAPLATLGGFALKTAADFQKSHRKMQAALGLTAEQTKELYNVAISVWREGFGESLDDVTHAITRAYQTMGNLPKEEMEYVTKAALTLAEVFDADVAESTRAAAQLMQQFGVSGTEAMDMITVAFQRGGDYSNELLDTISEYSTQFANLGFSAEQMMGMLISGAESGIWSMDKLADSVKESFLQITDGSENTKEALKELGLDYNQITSDIQSGGDKANAAFMAVMVALSKVKNEADRNRLAIELMGTPLEDLGPQYQAFFAQVGEGLTDFEGAAKDAGETIRDSFGTRVQKILRRLSEALVPLGEVMLDTIEPAIESASDAIEKFTAWLEGLSPAGQKAVVGLLAMVAAAGPLGIAFSFMSKGLGSIFGLIAGNIKRFGQLKTSMAQTAQNADLFNKSAGTAVTSLKNVASGATNTAGKFTSFGGRILGAVKNLGSLSKIAGIARLGLGALGGPMGLLATVGIPLLIQGGTKLYKHLKEESIPAIKDFGDKVSDSTTKSVLAYKKLNDEATAQLNYLLWSGKTISQDIYDSLTGIFGQMGDQISQSLKQDFDESYKHLSTFLANSKTLTAQEQQEILNNVKVKHDEQQKAVQESQNRIKQILETARKEKRALTEAEKNEINRIQQQMMTTAVQTMSKSEVEQKLILGRLRNETRNITAQQAAETVRNSLKAKEGAVKEANDKYKKVKRAIEYERDVTGSISAQQANKLIKEAKRQRDEAVAKAEDMHKKVVEHAKKQAKGQVDEIDWSTGQVLTKWDKMVRGVAKAVNAISSGINWVLDKIGVPKKYQIPMWKPKGYAKGTPSSGHPGGPAIVGEKGPELAYIPGYGTTLLGTKGPELHPNLPRGTAVLPNKETERLLKSYGFPGYANGVGDFFSLALSGADKLMNKVWKMFKPSISGVGGTLKTLGDGILSFLKDKSLDFIKDKIDEFFSFDGAAGNKNVRAWIATAVRITGVPTSWINPLVTIAMHESGGNPRAINLWDSNAKRGQASRGLMQTIPATFNAYKLPGLDDIWNPIHNAVAAIRYIIDRYGTVFNVPGIRNLMRGLRYVGYAKGTNYHPGGWAMVGEEGEELAYIPRKGLALVGVGGPTLMRLPAGTSVLPHDETKKFLSLWIPGYAKGVGEFPIEFRSNRTTRTKETPPVINITLNYQGRGSEEDAYRMLDIIERELGNRINTRLRMSGVKV
ncbi:phage tail tape measure protein, TP901 family, core region [Parageobacillus thermantarcticus]|uniref:Phage tail tape measure protein, TP901 family, core region n=1 Tax=Parageobacillus thermantarcticus TaxID=186116 RepID=A0A1I0TXQ1_9BACL|nr:phage tail tape measure protein [Parageobacillus thermantarcticus]SFA55676.1 phage tail tape measure protein, TP901 family, core region [Parageobacillus thermantarcticus]